MDSDEQGRSTCGVRDLRDGPVRKWAAAAWRPTSIVCWWRLGDAGARRRGSAPRAGDAATAQQRATSTTLAATRRHPCRPGMVAADCAWFRPCPELVVAPAALNDHQNLAALIILSVVSHARGAWRR